MKNFALGAFISLLVAATVLQALAQNVEEQRTGEPPASADRPTASADACKADVITVTGRSKGGIKRSTQTQEPEGKGAAMDDAVGAWEREVNGKFGEDWKLWAKAKDKSFDCAPARGIVLRAVSCTVSGRPCPSSAPDSGQVVDKRTEQPRKRVGVVPTTPAPSSDEEQAASCHGIIAAVGGLATSKSRALRLAQDTWIGRIMFDFGERYVDLNFAEEVSYVCPVAIPMNPSIAIKKVYFRCKIWARPCRPVGGVIAKIDRIERRYEEEESED
jgi:hypothetical protein